MCACHVEFYSFFYFYHSFTSKCNFTSTPFRTHISSSFARLIANKLFIFFFRSMANVTYPVSEYGLISRLCDSPHPFLHAHKKKFFKFFFLPKAHHLVGPLTRQDTTSASNTDRDRNAMNQLPHLLAGQHLEQKSG